MNKVVSSADEAVADISSGSTIMLGGFGLCGIPENLIAALVRRRIPGLHTISNNMGVDGFGMGLMLEAGMIASHVGSYVGENRRLETLVLKGELDYLSLRPPVRWVGGVQIGHGNPDWRWNEQMQNAVCVGSAE